MEIPQAIKEKKLLTFRYDGHPRTVEPHTYGIDEKDQKALCAYQVRGSSRSGEYRGWKTFHLTKMSSVVVSSESFASARPGYKRNDRGFKTIFAQLQGPAT